MGMWGDMGAAATSTIGGTWEIGLSLIGRALAQGDIDAANRIYDEMAANIDAVDIPAWDELVAQEVARQQDISVGSSGRTAQQGAIDRLQAFADQGGLDAQARAQLQQSMSLEDQRSRGNREAILQSRARRGLGGSGDELSALLAENQGSANRGRDSSLQIASDARQRALEALGQSASIGGQMRGQDISVEKSNVDAERERQLFNAKMRMAAAQANNEGKQSNAMLRLAKAKALNDAQEKRAGRRLAGAKQTAGDWASVGRGVNMSHQSAAEGASAMPF